MRTTEPERLPGWIPTYKWEGGWISFGRDDEGDLFVNINTEDAIAGVNDKDGLPYIFVYLNDGPIWDPRERGIARPRTWRDDYAEAKELSSGWFRLEWAGGGTLWEGWAENPIDALDRLADMTEFARYSDIMESPDTSDEEKTGLIGIGSDGLVYGIHTNGWVTVHPVCHSCGQPLPPPPSH